MQVPFEQLLVSPTVIVILALWSVIIKAFALWRAARRGQGLWFIAVLIFNTFGVIELIYLLGFAKEKEEPMKVVFQDFTHNINERRDNMREEAYDKIVALAKTKAITNDDIQDAVGVSDATATRYASALVDAGRLKRQGAGTTTTYTSV